jgi:hypothetical protein
MMSASVENNLILQLEDIQYEKSPRIYYEVYIDLPQGEKPNFHSANYVGSLSFFALKPHSMTGHGQGADTQKIARDYDLSRVARELSARGSLT